MKLLHQSEELRQLGKLAMLWLNNGSAPDDGLFQLNKILAQATGMANAEAKRDMMEVIE